MILAENIDSRRLRMSSLTAADAGEPYLSWLGNAKVVRWLDARFIEHDRKSLAAYIAAANSDANVLLLGIRTKSDGNHIGNIRLSVTPQHRRGDIGILLGEPGCWGHGYAAETIIAVCDFAVREMGVKRLSAGAVGANNASITAFLKAGFSEEGILRSHWFDGVQHHDVCVLGKVIDR